MIRRVLLAGVAIALLVPVAAHADEMEDMLEGAADAEFSGTGIVMCMWGEDAAASMYEITRSHGMSMLHGPSGDLMLSGSLSASRDGVEWAAIELGGWSDWSMSDRYRVEHGATGFRLGRQVTEVLVYEGDVLRVRLQVDDASTVPLFAEVFDDAGEHYRVAAMLDFSEGAADLEMPDDLPEPEMLMPADPSPWLPAEVAGYDRSDTYEMGGTTQAYYSDGLFSFSVFEARRGPLPKPFEGADLFAVDGEIYRRVVMPSVVWAQWDAPDRSYVLVGDLPPDHLDQVLAELPEPGRRNIFVRLWRRLFG